jgi:hypothetical protein
MVAEATAPRRENVPRHILFIHTDHTESHSGWGPDKWEGI